MWVIKKTTIRRSDEDPDDLKTKYEVGCWIDWGIGVPTTWNPIYTYSKCADAQAMVHYLNGGCLEHRY